MAALGHMLGLIYCHGAGGAVTPDVPTGFAAVPGSLNIAELSWDLVPGVSTNIYADGVLIDNVPAGTNTYSFTGSTPGTIYDFQISAVRSGLESALTDAISCATGEAFTGALDAFPPDHAWSHRRALVTTPVSSTLLQVRRTSDDVPTDVTYGTDGEAGIAGLLSFIGSSSGAVAALKDQVGSAHFVQATADYQRIAVDAGSLVTVGGKAASRGVGTGVGMTAAIPSYTGYTCTLFMRGYLDHNVVGFENFFLMARESEPTPGRDRPGLNHTPTGLQLAWVDNYSYLNSPDYLISLIYDGSNVTIRDGVNIYTSPFSDALNIDKLFLSGFTTAPDAQHKIQEVALWLSDQTVNEAAIRSALLA